MVQQPVKPKVEERKKLSLGVAFIMQLAGTAHPRYLGEFRTPRIVEYVVEFRAPQGQAMDRMTSTRSLVFSIVCDDRTD